jgi:hypothetical protein
MSADLLVALITLAVVALIAAGVVERRGSSSADRL